MKNKTVLVTGGAGFIGSHIVDRCLELGAKVIVLDNLVAGSMSNIEHQGNRIKFVNGSINSFSTVYELVTESDYIFHCAASKLVASRDDPILDMETNIMGTVNILEAIRGTSKRLIHASTGSVFGSSNIDMEENHPKNPTTLYGISKLAGEKYVMFYAKEFGVKALVIRYFHVYGPRQDYSGDAGVVSIFMSRILQDKPPIVYSGGTQIRCFTYVKDVVDATIMLALDHRAIGEDFNVASGLRMNINSLARTIINLCEKRLEPIKGEHRPGENYRPVPSTLKIRLLGFEPKVGLMEGLELTKKWIVKV